MKSKSLEYMSNILSKFHRYYANLIETINFFNLKIILLILILFLLFLLPLNIYIPNYFGISDTQASTILSIIIGALASILGVVIAVIIVAFNILRKYYNFYAFRTFFKNKRLSEFVTFYLSTITIAFIALIGISNPINPHIVNLLYLAIFLFIISLWILFPYSNAIISSTQSKENIERIVYQIDMSNAQIYNLKADIMASFSIEGIEENPIFVLNELVKRSLNDNDWLTSIYILEASEQKLFDLLDDHLQEYGTQKEKTFERANIIKIFLLILKPMGYQAIKTRHESILRNILVFVENLHYFGAQNQMAWYEVEDLNNFIKNLLKEALSAELDTIILMGFYTLIRILNEHLKNNVPLEDEVFKLQYWKGEDTKKEWDPEKGIQWDKVSRSYIEIIQEISKKSVELQNEEIFDQGITSLLDIIRSVNKMSLGDYQKFDLVKNCCWGINDIINLKSDANLHGSNFYLMHFQMAIKDVIKNSTEKTLERILYSYAYTFRALARNGILDLFELEELGGFCIELTMKIDENILYKKSVILIITLFDKLREKIEEQILDNSAVYVKLGDQLIWLRKWMKKENIRDEEIEKQIDEVLSNFEDYEKIKGELELNQINEKWPYFPQNIHLK